jgi:hypothetical protein
MPQLNIYFEPRPNALDCIGTGSRGERDRGNPGAGEGALEQTGCGGEEKGHVREFGVGGTSESQGEVAYEERSTRGCVAVKEGTIDHARLLLTMLDGGSVR